MRDIQVGAVVEVMRVLNGGVLPKGHIGKVTEVYGVRPTYRIDDTRAALYSRDEIEVVPQMILDSLGIVL